VDINMTGDEKENSVQVVLDVAHNPMAIDLLVNKIKVKYPNKDKRIVVGFSSDKNLSQCGQSLLSIVKDSGNIHLVESAHPRAAKIEAILDAEPSLVGANFDLTDRSVTTQVKAALKLALDQNEVLVVCGSIFLMAETRKVLGYNEPSDSKCIAEVAGAGLRHVQEVFGDFDFSKINK